VKSLYRNELTHEQYIEASYYFSALLRDKLKVEETPLKDRAFWDGAEAISKRYRLDLIDAVQIHSVARGQHSDLVDESRSLFITADRDLAAAARSEGVDVWDVMNEEAPQVTA
jgi:predicted nucleic acid-binding protein